MAGVGDRSGEPLCPQCYDSEREVLWNAMAPELWRRTAIRIPRELALLTGVSHWVLRERVRVSHVKVAEYQRHGALHFHVVMRLDAAQPRATAGRVLPPPDEHSCELLARALLAAVEHLSAPPPQGGNELAGLRWGLQTEIRVFNDGTAGLADAARTAAYLPKYATKSTETVGRLMYPLEADDLPNLRVRPHVRRLVECAC